MTTPHPAVRSPAIARHIITFACMQTLTDPLRLASVCSDWFDMVQDDCLASLWVPIVIAYQDTLSCSPKKKKKTTQLDDFANAAPNTFADIKKDVLFHLLTHVVTSEITFLVRPVCQLSNGLFQHHHHGVATRRTGNVISSAEEQQEQAKLSFDVVNQATIGGTRPLNVACRLGNCSMVQELLAHGAVAHVSGEAGGVHHHHFFSTPPLIDAARAACSATSSEKRQDALKVISLLCEQGVPIDVQDSMGSTTLSTAARSGCVALIDLALKLGAALRPGIIHAAVQSGKLASVQMLLDHCRSDDKETTTGKEEEEYHHQRLVNGRASPTNMRPLELAELLKEGTEKDEIVRALLAAGATQQ